MSMLSRFIARLPMPIITVASLVKTVLGGFFQKLAEIMTGLRDRIAFAAGILLDRVPPEKRRMAAAIAIGTFVIILLIIIGASLVNNDTSGGQRVSATENAPAPQWGRIQPDELFLPDEPDFVPGVLLEREPRSMWSAEDAAPFWQDLLKDGEQEWRDQIEKTVNEIMENVP